MKKKKERKNVFHHYLDCIFCIVCRKMAGRHSKRVRHEEPDVDTNDFECFVCHLKSQTCDRRVQLPCCKQYAHRRCQLRWEEHHKTCGLCRAPLTGCNDVTPVSAQNNHSDNDENAELARQEIIRNPTSIQTVVRVMSST